MEKIIRAMQELTTRRESFALATVISRNGSAPRSAGAKMLIRADSSIVGTVGGGSLEANVQRLAHEVIENHLAVIREFSFSGKDASTMDSICGGQVEILVEWVDGTEPLTQSIVADLDQVLTQHQKAWLVTVCPTEKATTTHVLVLNDSKVIGALPANLPQETIHSVRSLEKITLDQQTVIVEPVNISGTAYIFGAGHVSRSLAAFIKAVGFWTVVIDDRPEYANRERFPEVDDILVPNSLKDIMGSLKVDPYSFIIIVTRGHLDDQLILELALKTDAGYIGMIGSRRKCELIFQDLYKKGYQEKDIMRVHAPIGLPISAETPEEIGISITAEMIQERARLFAAK
jgi:xanthine dehydrogenase accessory factor